MAGTLLLSDPEGAPAPPRSGLGLGKGSGLRGARPSVDGTQKGVHGPDSPQVPGGIAFSNKLEVAAQKALQLDQPGVSSVQLNSHLGEASRARGCCLVNPQRDAEMDEWGTVAILAWALLCLPKLQ